MADRYRALLIGNTSYPEDPHNLQRLEGPINDISLLRAALEDPEVGMFAPGAVTLLSERTSHELVSALDEFFSAGRDEVVLLYYSGHGRLDETNTLYLCTRDTKTDRLRSTAVSSRRINEFIELSSAARTIIILDCCHSGAFKSGDIAGPIAGNGRYVLTSCRAKELANDASVANHASMFTEQVVAGIRRAATSRPAAGHLTIEELHVYVRDRLLEQGRQRPQFIASGEGGLAIARRHTTPPGRATDPSAAPFPGLAIPETAPGRDAGAVDGENHGGLGAAAAVYRSGPRRSHDDAATGHYPRQHRNPQRGDRGRYDGTDGAAGPCRAPHGVYGHEPASRRRPARYRTHWSNGGGQGTTRSTDQHLARDNGCAR
jgi:hypothetical protein